jgi:hypothetical protein
MQTAIAAGCQSDWSSFEIALTRYKGMMVIVANLPLENDSGSGIEARVALKEHIFYCLGLPEHYLMLSLLLEVRTNRPISTPAIRQNLFSYVQECESNGYFDRFRKKREKACFPKKGKPIRKKSKCLSEPHRDSGHFLY